MHEIVKISEFFLANFVREGEACVGVVVNFQFFKNFRKNDPYHHSYHNDCLSTHSSVLILLHILCRIPCKVCNKEFTSEAAIRIHSVVHTGLQPFKCGVCDKSFAYKDSLTKHERLHKDEWPFKCDVCDHVFRSV